MNKLEDFFEEDSYKELYIKNIQECKNKLTEYIQSNTPLFNFTDHGIEHSNRINEHISNLFSELLSNKDVNIRLNNSELYSLILSIYLHDVGMELINKEKIIESLFLSI